MSAKKKAAGNATSTAAKKNNSVSIIAEPIDIVNMAAEEIIAAAIGRLEKEDGEAKHDRYGAVIHLPVRDEEHYQQYLSEVFHGKQVKSAVRQGAGAA